MMIDYAENFNIRYDFSTFIVDSGNKEAYDAIRSMSSKTDPYANPLIIYGTSGSGKTHLLISFYKFIRETRPDAKIVYKSVHTYISEIIESIRTGTNKDFASSFDDLDYLLLDDFDELRGKEETQHEVTFIINNLFLKGKSIVVASKYHPVKYKRFWDKLRNRIQWGRVVEIKAVTR